MNSFGGPSFVVFCQWTSRETCLSISRNGFVVEHDDVKIYASVKPLIDVARDPITEFHPYRPLWHR